MLITLKNKNFARSLLTAGISSVNTTLTVKSGEGIRFPQSGQFVVVIWTVDAPSPIDDPNREIITMELVAGDTFSIVRGQENTAAQTWLAGDLIAHVITAGKIDELEDAITGTASIVLRTDAVNDEFDTTDSLGDWEPLGSRRIFDRITDKIRFICRAKSADGTQIEVKMVVRDEDTMSEVEIITNTMSINEVDLSGEIDISSLTNRCSFVIRARGNGLGGSYAIVHSIFVRLKT